MKNAPVPIPRDSVALPPPSVAIILGAFPDGSEAVDAGAGAEPTDDDRRRRATGRTS
jgi:hypothetical protein